MNAKALQIWEKSLAWLNRFFKTCQIGGAKINKSDSIKADYYITETLQWK